MRTAFFGSFVWLLLLNALVSADENGWQSLFDGKSLDGWKAAAMRSAIATS
jgi:hypothetical protein